jgi:hypothetical protein
MDLLKASELDLDDPDLKSLYDSPVVAELRAFDRAIAIAPYGESRSRPARTRAKTIPYALPGVYPVLIRPHN